MNTAVGRLVRAELKLMTGDPLVLTFVFAFPVVTMLIIGGAGYLYGGIIGAGVFIVIRDVVSAATPEYWEFWIGAMLVALVLIGRGRLAALVRLRP